MSLLNKLLQSRGRNQVTALKWDERGLVQIVDGEELRLEWTQIASIDAYKRDCFAVDQIRLLLGDSNALVLMEVSEEDQGYEEFVKTLPHNLPGCLSLEEWFSNVAFPPFENCRMTIYARASAL